MRIMGLDYGAATMGVAISDELLITAQPVETIRREKENQMRHTYQRIEELIQEYGVEKIVLGYPKNMNDTIGEKALKAEKVKEDIERRTGLPVILMDERLTTVQAHRVLDEAEMNYKKKAAVIDKLAASIILQTYLDMQSNEKHD
ncbi:MAG: Holliday junction resolvase RuvX [Lachnospiraceae bacterium]|jgi:putative Holliday junction resolvase|nr:Holliday junction resolvase RuvX [Lachnospiraceae bacterium]MBP5249771.1 Holliday junction resolvase RuvX [Lachnospiraceae bacterium]MBR6359954.1 Holliday junction resolvase RuvX [Lachnospiraceae bacterium]